MISSSSGAWPSACTPALQAGDVAVVVGAPDVDEQLEAAGELVAVVGDVGQQVGGLAVGLHEDAVLVVAEVGGAQPDGAVLLEHHPAVAEVLRGWRRSRPTSARLCSLNQVSNVTPMRAEALAQLALAPARSPTPSGRRRRASRPPTRGCTRPGSRPRAASVPALPRGQRRAEQLHLHAAVVEVVLAVDVVAACARGSGRASRRRPPSARRPAWSGPGGVGRHELDVDPLAAAEVEPRVAVLAAGEHVGEHLVEPGVAEVEVDEARARRSRPARRGPAAPRSSRATSSPASSRGTRPAALAVAMATLDDQSPCSRRPGRSRWISAGGSMPTSVEGRAQGGGEGVADHGRRMLRGPLFCPPDRSGRHEPNTFVSGTARR